MQIANLFVATFFLLMYCFLFYCKWIFHSVLCCLFLDYPTQFVQNSLKKGFNTFISKLYFHTEGTGNKAHVQLMFLVAQLNLLEHAVAEWWFKCKSYILTSVLQSKSFISCTVFWKNIVLIWAEIDIKCNLVCPEESFSWFTGSRI